eukprot:310088-Pleurochrysis_carterae.AAC.1
MLTYNGSAWVPGVAFSSGHIKLGYQAGGTNATKSIAIGPSAGITNQKEEAIAIGNLAGSINQEKWSICLGVAVGRNDKREGST